MTVDTNHEVFSSEGGITLPPSEARVQKMIEAGSGGGPGSGLFGPPPGQEGQGGGGPRMFIAMDPPKHDVQRKTVSPAVSPTNLAVMEPLIRERCAAILDSLPIGEPFDWVDKVSMELTAMTLATLFDMPQADRRRLTRWSDVVMAQPGHGIVDSWEQKRAEMFEYGSYFLGLWNQRVNAPPGGDLISMLAHGPATRDMNQFEYLGNVILLTIGGNDTTRNTISGSVYALNKIPDQYAKLRADPSLIPSMVSETIRWQTPLAHMRRVAKSDFELGGKQIRAGDIVVMWYVSGNRDDDRDRGRPDAYVIDRARARQHAQLRLRHPPLRRQPPRRAAAAGDLGRDPAALPRHPAARRAEAHLLDLREGLRKHAGPDPDAELGAEGGQSAGSRALPGSRSCR